MKGRNEVMRGMVLLVLLSLLVLAASAASAGNLLANGGFENVTLADGASAAGPGNVGGWPFFTTGTAIYNPAGNGSAEGMVVEEGNNYLKIADDPESAWSDSRTQWYSTTTMKANHRYTLRFRYGRSSSPGATWTRNTLMFGSSPNGVNFAGAVFWYNNYIWGGNVSVGWQTWEMTKTVLPGDPVVGMYIGFYLCGDTWDTADVYYYDQFELIESPIFPNSISYQGKLTNAQGQPVSDTPRDFVFKFYGQETGGASNWTSATMSITPSGGRFNAQIDNIPVETAFPSGDVWMEMVVAGETLSPRSKVTSVPFALIAGTVK